MNAKDEKNLLVKVIKRAVGLPTGSTGCSCSTQAPKTSDCCATEATQSASTVCACTAQSTEEASPAQ